MKVSHNTTTQGTATVAITISPEDIQDSYQKELKKQRLNTEIKGFRKGKAPMGLIEKSYGEQIKGQMVWNSGIEKLQETVKEQKWETLYDPILINEEQVSLNELPAELEFELALQPEVNLDLSKDYGLAKVTVEMDEPGVEKKIQEILANNPTVEELKAIDDEAKIQAAVVFEDEAGNEQKTQIEFSKNDAKVAFWNTIQLPEGEEASPEPVALDTAFKKAYIQSSLSEVPESMMNATKVQIFRIFKSKDSELNEEFFQRVFPNEGITELDGFKSLLTEKLKEDAEQYKNSQLQSELQNTLVNQANFELPLDFILKLENRERKEEERLSLEDIKQDEGYLKWQIIAMDIQKSGKIEISQEDFQGLLKVKATAYLNQMGFPANDQLIQTVSENWLKDEKALQDLQKELTQNKIFSYLIEELPLQEKPMKYSEFISEIEKQQPQA